MFFDISVLFLAVIGSYAAAAISSVIFNKNNKLANIIPNLLCILGATAGIILSLQHILGSDNKTDILDLKMPIDLISINIRLDSLSAFFILGLSVLVLCVSIYSIGYLTHYYNKKNIGLFNFLYSTFIISILSVLTAGNMVFFFISWEVMSMVSYFLVVFESENKETRKAGSLYIIMMHVGTAFLMLAFMILYGNSGSFDMSGHAGDMTELVRGIVFILFLIGFGTKAGIIPLHIWLPYAHPAASSNVSALMSGIMIKTAIYGIIRFIIGYLGVQALWWGIVILVIGALSTLLSVAYALMSNNIKRLLAYSSIENIGIILMGLGVAMIAISQNNMVLFSLAIIASLFHTFNHALFKGGLFLGAGSIQYSTHTKDMEELGGLVKKMPYTSVFMLCFSLAICAIVPFNGFIGEWFTYQSLFMNISSGSAGLNIVNIFCVAALAMAGAMALACFVKLYGISFLGKPRSNKAAEAKEVPVAMRAGMGILAAACMIFGLFPFIIINLIDKVSTSLGGTSIIDSLQGNFAFVYYPVKITEGSITPAAIFVLAAVLSFAGYFVIRLIGGKSSIRKYGTWDCGYEDLNSRMQYSATGFSKPLRIVFRLLYRPSRELQVKEGVSPYYPHSVKYVVKTEKIFEKYMYNPVIRILKNTSRRLKFTIQTGSMHMYLLYIFIALIALMLYNSLAK